MDCPDRRAGLIKVVSQPEKLRLHVGGKSVAYTPDYEMTFSNERIEVVEVTRTRYLCESLLGYALRLAFENSYGSANILRKLLQQNIESRLSLSPEIAADKLVVISVGIVLVHLTS